MSDPRLCLALDGDAATDPAGWVERTSHVFGVYKIGLELFCRRGRAVIDACRAAGAAQIFLDLKLHDIPRTVARTVAALAALEIDYLTVHAAGGRAMLEAAQAAAGETRLLAVTVLTSLTEAAAAGAGLGPLATVVEQRAQLAKAAGLSAVVCSPHEAGRARAIGLAPVTPGIRWADGATHDQARVADPASALTAGAHMLVIGRMITASTDVDAALTRLAASCR